MKNLPPLPSIREIQIVLKWIFPEAITNRNYLVREMSAKTIFVMLYIGAIEGDDIWLRPDQVTKMTTDQANMFGYEERIEWRKQSIRPNNIPISGRWYAQNTREPIRDETIRQGLVENGAVVERQNIPTTSPKGRYALTADFARCFGDIVGAGRKEIIHAWQEKYLSPNALVRLQLAKRAAATSKSSNVVAIFPNDEKRQLAPGMSSVISKEVIEKFAPLFLIQPAVLWLSESAVKEDKSDLELAKALGINIKADKFLPDMILVDIGSKTPLFVFVEVVASDGPVTEKRREALLKLVTDAGFESSQATFLTAYEDREKQAFRKTFSSLAWQSFAWCMSEPDKLIGLHIYQEGMKIQDLIK